MGTYREQYTFNFFKASHKEAQEKTRSLVTKVVELLAEADYKDMGILFQECKSIRYSAQGYQEDSQISEGEKETLVNIGYVNAMMDVMQMYLKNLNAQGAIQQVNTKYRDEVLSVLAKRGTMLHGDLASALGVSASGLNAIIKKMNSTEVQLIRVEEVSKYKLYSITPIAYKYISANNQELKLERESYDESKRRERFLRYLIEMNKIVNEKKVTENVNWVFEPQFGLNREKVKKYAKPAANNVYTAKYSRKLA